MFSRLTVRNVCIIARYNVMLLDRSGTINGHTVDCDSHSCRFDLKQSARNMGFMQSSDCAIRFPTGYHSTGNKDRTHHLL